MFNVLACFAESLAEHGGEDTTATQYFLDTGEGFARRGFCWGGVHLWEHCPSKGMEHFVKGAVPKDFGRTRPTYGLYEGKDNYPVDDLKLGMLNAEKLLSQYKWAAPGKIDTGDLKRINWSKRVLGYTDGKASVVINYDGLTVASKEGIPDQGSVVGFFLTPCVAQLVLNADVINLEWISGSQAVIAFNHSAYGGVISCWYLAAKPNAKEQREIIDVYFNEQKTQYKRFNNKLEKQEMKLVNIPTIPKTNKKAEVIEEAPQVAVNTVEKVEPEEIEKPTTAAKEVEQTKEALEKCTKTSENVENETPKQLENVEEPTIDWVFEDILKQITEIPNNPLEGVVKDLKFLAKTVTGLRKRVNKEMKHSADSAELKTLQQENKDLQKRVNALQATVKAQAELLQKQL